MGLKRTDQRWDPVRANMLKGVDLTRQKLTARPEIDLKGIHSDMLRGDLFTIGVLSWWLDGNTAEFFRQTRASAECWVSVLRRAAAGELIDESFLTAHNFFAVLEALAASSFDHAHELVRLMRSDALKSTMQATTTPFIDAMSTMILAYIEQSPDLPEQVGVMEKHCLKKDLRFAAYPRLVRALDNDDAVVANAVLPSMLADHRRLAKSGLFQNTDSELIAVWPMGLINLARSRGLNVTCDDPLIPMELLCPIGPTATSV